MIKTLLIIFGIIFVLLAVLIIASQIIVYARIRKWHSIKRDYMKEMVCIISRASLLCSIDSFYLRLFLLLLIVYESRPFG
jgi:hypothetical protein